MTDYRKQWREGIAAQPKYDVFVAYREKDEDLAKHLFDVFNQHGITYSTPADEERAKKRIHESTAAHTGERQLLFPVTR